MTDRDWEWITRRLLILGKWGYDTSLMEDRLNDPDFLTDEWLTRWFGEQWAKQYVLDDLIRQGEGQP